MTLESPSRPRRVIGPEGRPLTRDDLPPADTKRWIAWRKAEVVAAVRGGLISRRDACDRYRLSPEELRAWERVIGRHGLLGLRATWLQEYRPRQVGDRERDI